MRNNTLRVERPNSARETAAHEIREVMDIRQAAEYLGISTDSLYRYASDGILPGFRLGNRWRFRKSRLDQWMDEQSGIASQIQSQPKSNPARKKPVRATH
jgi:excisionase family DNA binding protein